MSAVVLYYANKKLKIFSIIRGPLGRPHHILLCYYGHTDAIIAPISDVRTAMLVSLMMKVLYVNFRSM
jgi:hypothetical protein